jgi:hypothetical protein
MNMYISEQDKENILRRSEGRLIEIIEKFTTLKRSGVSYTGKCPLCGNEDGLIVTPGKSIFKCFKCNDLKGKRPIDYLMKGGKMSFPEALKYLADQFGIFIEAPVSTLKPVSAKMSKKTGKLGVSKNSFCIRTLEQSGLSYEDVTAKIYKTDDKRTAFQSKTFRPGSIDDRGNIIDGDDIIIEYYDLDGNPIKFELKDKRGNPIKTCEYFRVRWQFPDDHPDKLGKPMKYRSPFGSYTYIYIPHRMRELYRLRTKIPVLFIQEGEKKAEKACKHGLPSIAISGIQNLGTNGKLPEDIIRIIGDCEVKSVVFMLDSDWNHLHHDIKISDNVARRPNLFFSAVRNYKDYMRTLINRNIHVEIYFGHVEDNEAIDKGIDDLLANTLSGREDELKTDINRVMNEKDMNGKYVKLYKITSLNDYQIKSIWCLENIQEFAAAHKNELKDMPEFKFFNSMWKFDDDDNVISAQPLEEYERFWSEIEKTDKHGNSYKTFEYEYLNALFFLQNRGFGRYITRDNQVNPDYMRIEGYTVRIIQHWEARQFLFDFSMDNCPREVSNMLVKGGTQYLGPDKMAFLGILQPNFPEATGNIQYFYFENMAWEITKQSVTQYENSNIRHHVWSDRIIHRHICLVEPLISFTKDESGNYDYVLSAAGKRCHFLQFLINASNFSWKKERLIAEGHQDVFISDEERQENVRHLLSKLCAMGYLALDFKDPNVIKAVVGMDGKQGNGIDSNGCCGKSLIGFAMDQVLSTAYINGKKKDLETDPFIWNDIVEKTQLVFMDDVLKGFKLDSQFANLAGAWQVNYKGGGRRTFPFASSPKMYISTNFTLRGNGDSFRARQWLLGFSDYYNAGHQPKDDFGILFFNEWEQDQWELFWNMMATAVQLYMNFGVIEAPEERLMQRIDMNIMGETFIDWAGAYFEDENNPHLNHRVRRLDMEASYKDELSQRDRQYHTAQLFREKILAYCRWKGYKLNPQKYHPKTGEPLYLDKNGDPNTRDMSHGSEYFTIADDRFSEDPNEYIPKTSF